MTYFLSPNIPVKIINQIKAFFEVSGKPLLEPFYPRKIENVIEAIECWGSYHLETIEKGSPPQMTWREFSEVYVGVDPKIFVEDMGMSMDDLDKEADPELVLDHWLNGPPGGTPSGKVYHMLEDLDLGPKSVVLDDLDLDHLLGYVSFIDGECPGKDWRGVRLSSVFAVSALQWKLTELNTGIKIIV